ALGVGLRLDGRDLADALDVRVERVGEWLVAGRRALDREMPDPCRKTAALVGRYDDRSVDPDERVEVITHLNRCPTCQQVVERSRAVDGVIVGELGRLRAGVAGRPAVRVTRLERMRRGAMAAGLAMLLILALVAGGAAVSRLTQGPHEPAPLVGREAHAPYSGWLVLARSDGSVLARHLSTGGSRRIIDSDDPVSGVSGQVTLSPGGTRLMTFYSEYSRSPLSRVIVNALDGAEIGRLEWSFEDRHYYPTGWIDERRVLVSVFPVVQQGQTAESNAEWYEDESRLLIVDVETGQERELLRGNVAFGIPSPDGKHVAVARMMDRNTVVPSANALAIEIWPVEANAGSEPIVTVDGWVTIGKGLIWAGDGSRLFATLAVEAEDEQPATNTERRTTPNYEPHAIFAIELDGETRRLAEAGGDSAIYPASAAPDGSAVVYLRSEGANVLPAISYWRVGADGGEPEQLSGAVAASYGGYGVAWSPDGAAVLVSEVAVPYLEREDTEWSRWNAASTRIVAVASGGQRT
ncbi:MAG: zf-HC2 domain-containing protein, partial [Thermomicrobiales bacterium]